MFVESMRRRLKAERDDRNEQSDGQERFTDGI